MPVVRRLAEVAGMAPLAAYSHAVVTDGPLAHVAGQVAVDEAGALVGAGDVGAQARQALHNLGLVLAELGADWSDVVKLGWYLLDAGDLQAVRDARDAVLDPAGPKPASTLVQVAALFQPGFLVEVDAVVALPG
jgi:enamine deaminase RidA (YjgF/YER057c/UK114 family)